MSNSNQNIYDAGKAQSSIMYCILGYVLAGVFASNVVAFLMSLAAIYYVYKLACALEYPVPWLIAGVQIFPLINLILLLVLVNAANKALKSEGIRVGLMGASSADLEKLLASGTDTVKDMLPRGSAPKGMPSQRGSSRKSRTHKPGLRKPVEGSSSMAPPLKSLCIEGEKADKLVAGANFNGAIDIYNEIIDKMFNDLKEVDSFVLAKTVLGLLVATSAGREASDAHEIWTAEPKSKHGLGIQFIESGQTSPGDLMAYFSVCSYLYSLAADDVSNSADSVNKYMTKVCTYFFQEKMSEIPQALSNWHRFLATVYEGSEFNGTPPADKLQILHGFAKKFVAQGNGKPAIMEMAFPELDLWKPSM